MVKPKGIRTPSKDMSFFTSKSYQAVDIINPRCCSILRQVLNEIDSLNGALVSEAKALNISVPFNQALVKMVKAEIRDATAV